MSIFRNASKHKPNFDAGCIKGHSLKEFARWVQASTPTDQVDSLTLPPLQRQSLWRPRQILGFWDSLFRGLPIGMFYLVRRQEGEDGVGFERGALTRRALPNGFDLIDGHQRTRTLMLAFDRPRDSSKCLWIDLTALEPDGSLSLRLTTRSQPFGYNTEGNKLAIHERRLARINYEKRCARGEDIRFISDHELFDREINANQKPPHPHLNGPAQGNLFVPLDEVMAYFEAASGDRSAFEKAVGAPEVGTGRQASREVLTRLHVALTCFSVAEVALFLVDLEAAQGENSELLLRLFERIGAGGTPLSEPERLYSIYKHRFPRVRDLVEGVEKSAGRMMTSTMIANTALRIANVSSSSEYEAPSPQRLKTLLNRQNDDDRGNRFYQVLTQLLPVEGKEEIGFRATNGRLESAFRRVRDLLLFHASHNPNGLPNIMLAQLPHELIQVMVYWAFRADRSGEIATQFEAEEAIRFALFWKLCAKSNLQCARNAIHWIRSQADTKEQLSIFPGGKLYNILTNHAQESWGENALALVPPDQLSDFSKQAPRGTAWLSHKNRFEHDQNHPARRLYGIWWWSGGRLLLWLQRKHLEAEFPRYDPLSDHDEDLPIDLDHIQPRADWRFDWSNRKKKYLVQLPESDHHAFYEGRDQLGDSIGNFRWVASAKNRSDGALALADKLHRARGDDVGEAEAWLAEAFDPAVIEDWIAASASEGWTTERVVGFQRVVEERALWLYRRFFEEAGFARWLEQS